MIQAIDLPPQFRSVLEPPEDLSVSHWSDRYRLLDPSARYAGPWRTRRTPYLREPMDAVFERGVRSVTFIKPARVGGTEMLNNVMAYAIDANPLPTLYVQPQQQHTEEEMAGRIRSLIQDSPQLARHIPGGDWATKHAIQLATMTIHGVWATSPTQFIRRTVGLLINDEIDNIEQAASWLGDILSLASERLATYGSRAREVNATTPTYDYAAGWRKLNESDYRRPYVPCPKCGEYQVLQFGQIRVPEGQRDPTEIRRRRLGRYECLHCKAMLDHHRHHKWMIDRVVWVPRLAEKGDKGQPLWPDILEPLPLRRRRIRDVDSLAVPPYDPYDPAYAKHRQWRPKLSDPGVVSDQRGYSMNVLYSPWESRTWSDIIAHYFQVHRQPEQLRVFVNSWLGEPWRDRTSTPDWHVLRKRAEGSYRLDRVPPAVKMLLAGADVQADTVYYTLWGFGAWDQRFLIRYGTVDTLDQLYDILFRTTYPITPETGSLPIKELDALPHLRCSGLMIDSGYADRRDEVLEFGKRESVIATIGRANSQVKKFQGVNTETFVRSASNPNLYITPVELYKGRLIHGLRRDPDTEGAFHFPRETSDELLRHLTSERPVQQTIKTGKRKGRTETVWQVIGPNHYLDCTVLCLHLADGLGAGRLRPNTPPKGVVDPTGFARRAAAKTTPKRPRKGREYGGSAPAGMFSDL